MDINNTIDLCDELGQNFINFAYEANSQRAFPDARDGLKPGQRACLWEMYEKGYISSKPHVKSAKISGGVIASWWPHSDSSIYDTFTRMSQNWINNTPEVDWHGANGNQIIGPEAAASRYTEARLSKLAEDGLLMGIKKKNVPMVLNFSEDAEWPTVFPAILPRLLTNGSQGIGLTIANCWLPHSLESSAKVLINYIETGEVDYNNFYPSFPSGGIIINKDDIHNIYETGKGSVILRGKTEIKGNSIFITELPYQVYVEPYIDSIKNLILKDTLVGIEEVLNCSDKKNGLCIEVVCSDAPKRVLANLYAKTDLQKTFHANQWALVGKTPKLLTLKDYCEIYLNHNIECYIRELNFDLEKYSHRKHIVDGLLIALEDLDNVISLIKNSQNAADAKEKLIAKYHIDEIQAKSILGMKLSSLAKLEKLNLETERKELVNNIDNINNILSSKDKQKEEIKLRLSNLANKYKNSNKTEVIQVINPKENENKEIEFVEPEKCVVILTEGGLIKRIPAANFRNQKRNGKGIKTQNDITQAVIRTNTIDNLMIFTNKGKMYRLLVDNIPVGTNVSQGQSIKSLVEMGIDESPEVIYSIYRETDAKYVLFVSKKGLVKKTSLDEYTKTKKKSGLIATTIREGDDLAAVSLIKDEQLILITHKGMCIRIKSSDFAPSSRASSGIKGITLGKDDYIVAALPIRDEEDQLAIFSSNGLSKKFSLSEILPQSRGGKGLICYKPTAVTGDVAAAALVEDNDNILILGDKSSIYISASEIPSLSRASIGNQVIKDNKILSVSKV